MCFEAGLTRWLKLDKGEFIGREALAAIQAEGPKRKIIGLEMIERGIARDGYSVLYLEWRTRSAQVTSGSPAPFLKTNIAMALVPTGVADSGSDVLVDVQRQSGAGEAGSAAVLQAARRRREEPTRGPAGKDSLPAFLGRWGHRAQLISASSTEEAMGRTVSTSVIWKTSRTRGLIPAAISRTPFFWQRM